MLKKISQEDTQVCVRLIYHFLPNPLLRLLLYCFIALFYFFGRADLLFADDPLVTYEFRYHMPKAGEVYLVWGINGWGLIAEELRPAGTVIAGNNVMQTPMVRQDDIFTIKIKVPPGSALDYGFLTLKDHTGMPIKWVWDGDYRLTASKDDLIEVKAAATVVEQVPESQDNVPLVTQEFHYRLPEAGEVVFIWGINGWELVAEELRPAGTVIFKNKIMHTPMTRHGDTFTVEVKVPSGSILDYGFLTLKDHTGVPIKWVWDGDYQLTSLADNLTEIQTSLTLIRVKSLSKVLDLGLYLFGSLGTVWTIWFGLRLFPRTPKRMKRGVLIVLVNITPIVIFFFIGEIYLRLKGFDTYTKTLPGEYQNGPETVAWVQLDPILGWVANSTYPEVNSQGFRNPKDFTTIDFNSAKKRVMILGDSFMWGSGVNVDENVTSFLHRQLKEEYEFFNLGVPGWGIDQMYIAYQQYKDIIKPDIVILAFIDDDINRVLEAYRGPEGVTKPSFAIRGDELVLQTSPIRSQQILNRIMEKSVFFSLIVQQIYLAKDARPIVKYILLDMAQDIQRRKAKFMVVRIPTLDYESSFTINQQLNSFKDTFEGTNVIYLEPAEEITQIPDWKTDLYLDDIGGHLNVVGNQYLADYIYRHGFDKLK